MKKRVVKQEPQRKLQEEESYLPVEEWRIAPEEFRNLKLRDGEYTIIANRSTGIPLYLVAKVRNLVKYTAYIDGCVKFTEEGFVRIPLCELEKR